MHLKKLSGFVSIILLLLGLFTDSNAQVNVVRSENKVIIEGKVFYVHIVKAGQTLYSISRAYGVSEKDITTENPGTDSGLQIGQVVKVAAIPSQKVIMDSVKTPPDTSISQHTVTSGETMYSIAAIYSISVAELERINPEIKKHDIRVGQRINIPQIKPEEKLGDYTCHRVRRKETIFGIAKLYNISEELLKKYNPELLIKYPKPGQLLKIPKPESVKAIPTLPVAEGYDSLHIFDVQKYDTLKIARNYTFYIDSLPDILNKEFNVAYLIPFNYRPFEEIIAEEQQNKTKDDIINLDHESNPNDQMLSSRNFLEFMEGSLLAIDSLKNEGIAVNVFFFDTQKSPTKTREILNSREFRKIDLIIGPFYSYNVEIVSDYSREHHVPVISPLSGESGPVQNNPLFFQLNPGYETEYDRVADYVSGLSDRNIVLIHGTDSLELEKYNYLKRDLLARLSLKSPGDSVYLREIVFSQVAKSNLSQDLVKILSPDRANIVVVPETDEAFVTTVVTQLYFQLKNYNISVVGMPHWSTFQNIDFNFYHKLSLQYFTPYYFSYESANVKHFLKDYRKNFYSEPVTLTRKGGSYAFLGYDLSYYFLKKFSQHGRKFILHLNDTGGPEIMNDFHFIPVNAEGGFENRSLMLVKFSENLDITASPYEIAVPMETTVTPVPAEVISPIE